ncbi:MAG: RnfABCDGE type electron transport complex subunit B [Victivallales bacterium]|nr:RnfABCDGE type electron transport complex subunit B [Victivallales bacterium]MCF7888688.1 RnfABCDGE type electron transport complex subunit B [Victivallales bacterium]
MLDLVILSAVLVVCMGIVLGLTIGIVAKVFEVKQDERIELVEEELPGANCGGCGFAGCSDFAKAIVGGTATPDQCPVCAEESVEKISKILGLETEPNKVKKVAVVLCGGDKNNAKFEAGYNGINDCKSAVLIGSGVKGCKYGCLGLGTCARACPFNAIEIKNGLAVVHPELCVGCGKCIETCPRNLIKFVPETVRIHVFCNSPEKGPAKKKVCSVACIGCRKCWKNAEENQIIMKGFLARVNYDFPPPPEIVEAAGCPTGCLRRTDGD